MSRSVPALPQESAEWAPYLGEQVVAEVERLGHFGAALVSGAELVTPSVDRFVAHQDGELENLARLALGDLASGPIQDGPFLVASHVSPVARTDFGSGGAPGPLGLDHLRAVFTHFGDVTDKLPDPLRRGVDVQSDCSMHEIP